MVRGSRSQAPRVAMEDLGDKTNTVEGTAWTPVRGVIGQLGRLGR